MTSGHLCSGYDGLGLALDMVEPHEALYHAEIEPAASRLLEREYPDVPNIGDFVEVLLADLWRLAPHVDLLAAGFPCQPVSSAGRQLAELDHRWLWPFIIEIIRQRRPFRVFLENVQNLVSIQKGAIFRGILADLRAAGYAVRWTVLGACAVGAPHHRHRVFLVADLVGAHAPEAVRIGDRAICGAPRSGGRALLPSPMARDGDGRGEGDEAYWLKRFATRTNGVPLGAAVSLLPTPLVGSRPGASPPRDRSNGPTLYDVAALLPTPRASDGPNGGPNQRNGKGVYDALPGLVVNLLPTPRATDIGTEGRRSSEGWRPQLGQAVADQWGKYAEAVALWEVVTGRPAPEPTEPSTNGGRRLSPLLPEWMMGLPAGYLTKEASRPEALKLAGNGVVPLQAAAAYRLLTS